MSGGIKSPKWGHQWLLMCFLFAALVIFPAFVQVKKRYSNKQITPSKTSMKPENEPLEKEIPIGNPSFPGSMSPWKRRFLLETELCTRLSAQCPLQLSLFLSPARRGVLEEVTYTTWNIALSTVVFHTIVFKFKGNIQRYAILPSKDGKNKWTIDTSIYRL